jgi:hypothetical protein
VVPPSGEGHKRLDAALKVLGDLLGTVVGPGARRCDLEFEVRDRRRAGVVLDGLTTGTGDADPVESLRRWSACTSTVSNAVLCLLEYLCAGSPYYSPQLRDVWKGVRAALNDKLSVPEDWDEEAKENAAIVDSVVSMAQGVLLSQPLRSDASRTVRALIAAAPKGLWRRVSLPTDPEAESAMGAARGTGSEGEGGGGSSGSGSESDSDGGDVPAGAAPIHAGEKALHQLCSPWRRRRGKQDAAALLAGVPLTRGVIRRERLSPEVQSGIVGYLFQVGVTTPLAYGVQKLKPIGREAVIAASYRLASYRQTYQGFLADYKQRKPEAAGEPPCSFITFYRIACELVPRKVQVRFLGCCSLSHRDLVCWCSPALVSPHHPGLSTARSRHPVTVLSWTTCMVDSTPLWRY